jgi:hypothetical protein
VFDAKGGETTSWGGVRGRLNIPQLSFSKVDYDVNVNPKNLEVDVNIKASDSVNHYDLNDTDANWEQHTWGYMVYPKSEKQLYDVLKALRVSVSKKRLADFVKDGSYAKGGEVLYKYKVSAISKGGNRLGDKVAKTKKEAEEMKKEYLKKEGIKKVEITKNILKKPTYAKGGKVEKKENNEMIMGGLAGILLGIFLNK